MHHSVNVVDHSIRECIPNCVPYGNQDIRFSRYCCIAEECEPGDLFFAILTDQRDGHDDVNLEFSRGACGVVSERILPTQLPTFVVDDTRTAYGRVAHRLQGNPCTDLTTIGVTGAYGKTATALLVQHVLVHLGDRCGALTDLFYDNGSDCVDSPLGLPGSRDYATWLRMMSQNQCSAASMELSYRSLSEHSTAGISLDFAVITRLPTEIDDQDAHLLPSRGTQSRILHLLKPNGVVIINADDPASRFELPQLNHPVLTVGTSDDCEIWVEHLSHNIKGQDFMLHAGDDEALVRSSVLGHHHVYHCMLATAVALVQGHPLDRIADALTNFLQCPGHLEVLDRGQDFNIFIDAANSPATLNNALHSLRQVTQGRLIVVYGPGAESTRTRRAEMGRVAEKAADIGIITENNPAHEEVLEIAHDIIDGYRRPARAHVIASRERAIVWSLAHARPGDTVLIAGKGFQTNHALGNQTLYFDDRQIADICLEQLLDSSPVYGRDILPFPVVPNPLSDGEME